MGYLGLMPGLESLLQALQAAGVCALLFVRGMPDVLRQHYSSPQMQFIDRPVDLHAAAAHFHSFRYLPATPRRVSSQPLPSQPPAPFPYRRWAHEEAPAGIQQLW